jgi:hypothetical protein
MKLSKYEKAHIVDFAEEALLQVMINPENSNVKPHFDALCTLITTTPKDGWTDDLCNQAQRYMKALGIYRDLSKKYFKNSL